MKHDKKQLKWGLAQHGQCSAGMLSKNHNLP